MLQRLRTLRRAFASAASTTEETFLKPHFDYKHIAQNAESYLQNAKQRNVQDVNPLRIRDLVQQRSEILHQVQALRTQQNSMNKKVAKGEMTREQAREQGIRDSSLKKQLEQKLERIEDEMEKEALKLPNWSSPQSPIGPEENAKLLGVYNQKEYNEPCYPHPSLMSALSLMVPSNKTNAVCGERSYIWMGEVALLEFALIQYAFSFCIQKGFIPLVGMDYVRMPYVAAAGFQPRDEQQRQQCYTLKPESTPPQALLATSEHLLAGLLSNTVQNPSTSLPYRYVSFSHCFRTEVGKGKADRHGVYRVHQFSKVEMFSVCTEEQSEKEFEVLIQIQKELYDSLGLHFRQLEMPSEELGASAFRKVDCEAWFPGYIHDANETVSSSSSSSSTTLVKGRWGEISSASNCTSYQSRRLNIRYRKNQPTNVNKETGEKALTFAHTLNATAIAVPRVIAALLEQNQSFQQETTTASNNNHKTPSRLTSFVQTDQGLQQEPVHAATPTIPKQQQQSLKIAIPDVLVPFCMGLKSIPAQELPFRQQ